MLMVAPLIPTLIKRLKVEVFIEIYPKLEPYLMRIDDLIAQDLNEYIALAIKFSIMQITKN